MLLLKFAGGLRSVYLLYRAVWFCAGLLRNESHHRSVEYFLSDL